MTDYARTERRLLADLLAATGPDLPTVCEGWTTRDLAAHVVTRDRRPDAMLGEYVKPLAAHGEKVRLTTAARPFEDLVADVRTPPAWSLVSNTLTDELANGVEMFVHHEDVRRAQPGWEPRVLSHAHEAALWKAVKLTSRLTLRHYHPIRVEAPGFGVCQLGDGHPRATLLGAPSELVLFISGRQRITSVEVTGDESLRTARFRV